MKSLLIIGTLFLLHIGALHSQNLVPNPSFEDTVYCPDGFAQLNATQDWLNFGITPDYFNICGTNGFSVPNSLPGFQNPKSGVGMAGLFIRRNPNSPDGPNAREFIAVQLSSNLLMGTKYYFSCFINFSNYPNVAVACNNFGMKLSTISYYPNQYSNLVNNFAHIVNNTIVTDSINWVKISGDIIIDSLYQYLILGNFFEDLQTDTLQIYSVADFSYYYVDDVCFGLDSTYCNDWTSLNNHPKKNQFLNFFPNPVADHLTLNSHLPIVAIEIYDTIGRRILNQYQLNKNKLNINLTDLSTGTYYLKTIYESDSNTQIFIKL